MTKEPAACGTSAGRQRHLKHKEEVCPACRAAGAAYMREYRAREGKKEQARARMRLAGKARREVVRRHPAEYRAILSQLEQEELARLLTYTEQDVADTLTLFDNPEAS